MRKLALAAAAIGAISLVSVAPVEARRVYRGWGPEALAFGTSTAAASYYYGPNYYYGPAHPPWPYVYSSGPVYYGRPYRYVGPYW
jgi:hypothetical protein